MDNNTETRRKTIINIVYWVLVLGLIYFAITKGLSYVMPFLLGFVIAMIVKPAIDWMERKLHMKRRLSSTIAVAFFYIVIGGLLTVLGVVIVNQVTGFFANFDTFYNEQILPAIQQVSDLIRFDWSVFDPEIADILQTAYDSIGKALMSAVDSLTDTVVQWGRGTVTALPGFFVNMLFTIVSTFFIASDYYNITGFILRQLPARTADIVVQFKQKLGGVILQYLRSYSIILGITFAELVLGLWVLGVDRVFLLAFVIAVFDILPVVGTGAVLAPWGIISMIQGNLWMGLGLLALWLIITIIRNIIEPKIVGDNVGLHPLVTLVSMYLGTKLFGGIGLFGLPITMAILNELNRKGAIHLFRMEEKPPTDDGSSGPFSKIKKMVQRNKKADKNDGGNEAPQE